ncbi:hypothetical protein [Rickettsia tamurae]|nr:hypothetical protein [Rickettsia tamurae]
MQIIIKIKKETNNIFVELKKYVIPALALLCGSIFPSLRGNYVSN